MFDLLERVMWQKCRLTWNGVRSRGEFLQVKKISSVDIYQHLPNVCRDQSFDTGRVKKWVTRIFHPKKWRAIRKFTANVGNCDENSAYLLICLNVRNYFRCTNPPERLILQFTYIYFFNVKSSFLLFFF